MCAYYAMYFQIVCYCLLGLLWLTTMPGSLSYAAEPILFLVIQDGFLQFASGSICALDLTQAGSAEVPLSAVVLLAEGPPDSTYLFSMFSLLRNVSTFRLASVRSVETLRSLLTVSWASYTLIHSP